MKRKNPTRRARPPTTWTGASHHGQDRQQAGEERSTRPSITTAPSHPAPAPPASRAEPRPGSARPGRTRARPALTTPSDGPDQPAEADDRRPAPAVLGGCGRRRSRRSAASPCRPRSRHQVGGQVLVASADTNPSTAMATSSIGNSDRNNVSVTAAAEEAAAELAHPSAARPRPTATGRHAPPRPPAALTRPTMHHSLSLPPSPVGSPGR